MCILLPTTRSTRTQTQTMQKMSTSLLLWKRMSKGTLEEEDEWTQKVVQKKSKIKNKKNKKNFFESLRFHLYTCRIFLVILLLKQSEVKRVPLHCNNATLMLLKYKNYLLTLSYIFHSRIIFYLYFVTLSVSEYNDVCMCIIQCALSSSTFLNSPTTPPYTYHHNNHYLPQVHPHNSTTYYLLNYPTTLIPSTANLEMQYIHVQLK